MKSKQYLAYTLLAIICLIFISIFSWNTSPLYHGRWEGMDSAVFKLIGHYWSEGLIPYVEIWDQKGPLIHAINAFGYILTGNYYGIFIIQFVSLYVTSIYIFKSLQFAYQYISSIFLTTFIILSLSINYEGGNLVEEYLLPFIALSYYFLLCFTLNGWKNRKQLFMFCILVGLSLAFSLFTRLTNCIGLCASELVICIWAILDKRYKLFAGIAVSSLIGFMAISIPIIIYFYYYNALSEMWYGTFIYNVEYATSMSNISKTPGFFMTSLNCFILLFVSLVLFVNRYFREGFLWIMSALLPFVWFLNGANYPHYGMIVFQYLPISCILIRYYIKENHHSIRFKCFVYITFGIIITTCICVRAYKYRNVFTYGDVINRDSYVNIICQKYNINKESLLLYNFTGKDYLEENIKPAVRFFYLHDFLISNGSSIEQKIYNSLAESDVEWIIAKGGVNNIVINKYVNDHYEIIDNENDITVFKLK